MTGEEGDEIVSFPVAKKYLPLIIQTLAQAMTAEATLQDPPPQQRKLVEWNASNLERLRRGLRTPAPLALLDLTAGTPGERIYFEEVRDHLNQTDGQTRAQIGTLTKTIKRELGVETEGANWPVRVEWDAEAGKMFYVMTDETAAAWRTLTRK